MTYRVFFIAQAAVAASLGLAHAAAGCGSVVAVVDPTVPVVDLLPPIITSAVSKVDILFAIDNSRSMADKQQILARSVPNMVGRLLNPPCVDSSGKHAQTQPDSPLAPCTPGTQREFPPITDIHFGIITSSLGGHGSDACGPGETLTCAGTPNISNNDAGHLVSRRDACGGEDVDTYQKKKFLAWDPAQQLSPPGEGNLGDEVDPGIVPSLRDMVIGAGQVGCGYEAQLESWYRFLVDPAPYKRIVIENGKAVAQDVDEVLLQQRADFLRPSSLLAIIQLTDENDCSIKDYGQFYFAAQQRQPDDSKKTFHLPRARAECLADPHDPCCKSCGQNADECPVDEACEAKPTLDDKDDDINLRCFDQKRRFGIDFLYDVDRYTQGISSLTIENRQGDIVPNPIFTDLNPNDDDSNVRDPSLVFFSAIVGVPWQDLARDPSNPKAGFKTANELSATDATGHDTWDYILGDPASLTPPLDPHMIESIAPRAGQNPMTGDSMAPPGSPNGADPINGHEWNIAHNDLQYACVFDLAEPRDCSQGLTSCDCGADVDPMNPASNPLCEPDPKTMKPTLQTRAKGYPGLRHLEVAKGVGMQGVVASICPAQLDAPTDLDFGYRPALEPIVDRLKVALAGQCLPRSLELDANGQVACVVIEARHGESACDCDPNTARLPIAGGNQAVAKAVLASPIVAEHGWNCLCEIRQLHDGDPATDTDDALEACQLGVGNPLVTTSGQPVDGWCYVDATTTPPTGNLELVKHCPEGEQRMLRFVGAGSVAGHSAVFISCATE